MSTSSNDTTQDLTLDTIDASSPVRAAGKRTASRHGRVRSSRGARVLSSLSHSPDSRRRSMLSLDDLSHEGKRNDDDDDDDGVAAASLNEGGSDREEDVALSERPSGASTRRVEERLQLNLQQQQKHYARQRQLFEDLRSDAADPSPNMPRAAGKRDAAANLSPSVFSSSSHSSDSDHRTTENNDNSNSARVHRHHRHRSPREKESTHFQLELESELTGIALTRQTSSRPSSKDRKNPLDYRNDKDALRELSRIKAKAISDYERRMAETQQSQSRRLRPTVVQVAELSPLRHPSPTAKAGKKMVGYHLQQSDFVEELSQQEASNDALRKQLELLRRLQVENNRFRQDFRACREQNEALEAQTQLQKRELKRLREDAKDLALKIEQDQQSLAVAAHTSRKFKSCQKQLSTAQHEIEKLQRALHESLELQEQSQAKAIADRGELATETKRLKRSLKQLKQQEAKVADENELLRNTVEALESELNELKSELHTQQRDGSALASQLADKTSQCDAIEASATACVQRMESGIENLQKAFDTEREKRKKLETQRTSLQTQIDKLEIEASLKQQQSEKLEHHVAQLQDRLRERKLALQHQKQSSEEHVEELLEKQALDTKTILTLRGDCESVEQQIEAERSAALDAKTRVAAETRKVRKELEGLRSYIESSMQSGGAAGAGATAAIAMDTEDASDTEQEPLSHHHHHHKKPLHSGTEIPPELQFLNGATSALRTEMMNFVHEFQRMKHATRQLTKKLKTAQDRNTELERLRSEDALKINELREQRVLSEQARDIVNKEKLEVLKWSQQMCEKSEALESELSKCNRGAQALLQKLKLRRESGDHEGDSRGDRRKAESPPLLQCFKSLDSEVDTVLSTQQELRQELAQLSLACSEQQSGLETLERELEAKTRESEQTMGELEALHAENAREQKAHFDAVTSELEHEKIELGDSLHAKDAQLELLTDEKARLEALISGFEQDLPVFATILRLFVLVMQPLVLQVSELLSQKRFLARENAEYAQSQEQFECIGQVLKELVPMHALHQLTTSDKQRHRRFRRVVIAVFALNRFQKCGALHSNSSIAATGNGESSSCGSGSFGTCTSLKPPKKRRSNCSSVSSSSSLQRNPPLTVIKVLPPGPTLSNLNLRVTLERLKALQIAEKVADVIDMDTSETVAVPFFGSLLVQVLAAIDPSARETLLENTSGGFHCQALLEQRRRPRKSHKQQQLSSVEGDFEQMASECELSTVDLIRKRILALGKRVEDLHFQRNALQKDNYEFQFQLEQQATQLKHMDVLAHKTSELESEMQSMREQSQRDQQDAQQRLDMKHEELECKAREMEAKASELALASEQIRALSNEISGFQERIVALDAEKQALHDEVTKLKLVSIEEEEKAEVAKAGAKKQDEEVRNLKQAARKAHELYQKMNWQLEQEIAERVNLQASVDLLKRQKDGLEKELHDAKLRDLEMSFEAEGSDGELAGSQSRRKQTRKHHKVRFASSQQQQQQHEDEDSLDSSASYSDRDDTVNDRGGKKKARALGLALEDTCLYHKYEHPGKSTAHDESDKSDNELQSSSQVASKSASHPLSPRSTDANSKFLDEWRRLQISSAFDDDSHKSHSRHHQVKTSSSKAASATMLSSSSSSPIAGAAATTSKQIAREVEIQSNRRRIEIDKVNLAVHDYMDRIDEKLQQMYGIPPSTASRLRASGEGDTSTSEDEGTNSRCNVRAVASYQEHADAKKLAKADETRQVHWYG